MILEVNNVSKAFGGIKALNKCSFDIKEGEITAIIGPNGSGKSTVFNVISNLYFQDEGTINYDGKDISNLQPWDISNLGIARTFQQVRLFQNLTIEQHMDVALDINSHQLATALFKKKQNNRKRAKEALELVGFDKPLSTLGSDLSYGQRKLLDLAIAIANSHKLLMLDEPVAGVNPRLRKEIKQVIKKLRKDGQTILLIEHDMNFVMDLADIVIVMDEGKVLIKDIPKKVQNNKRVLEAYLGN